MDATRLRSENFSLRVERDRLRTELDDLHREQLESVKKMTDYCALRLAGAMIFDAPIVHTPQEDTQRTDASTKPAHGRRYLRSISIEQARREFLDSRKGASDDTANSA